MASGCVDRHNDKQTFQKEHGIQNIKIGDVELISRLEMSDKSNSEKANQDIIFFNVKLNITADKKFKKEQTLYLDFDMQQDFSLSINNKTLSPAICEKIANGNGNSYEYMIAFDLHNDYSGLSDVTLTYKDKIFGVGTVAFAYDKSDLKILGFKS